MRSSVLLISALLFPTVFLPQRTPAQWERPRTIEYRAMDELYAYYRAQRVSPTHPPGDSMCIGRTMWDCFKGDYLCVEFRSCDRDSYLERRAKVVARLDSAAVEISQALGLGGDLRWVEGQRVAFRLADRRFDEAAEVARACASSDWWCAALRGYISHLQHDFEAADKAFRASVAFMPDDIRCEWTSLNAVYGFDEDYRKVADECNSLPLTHPIWDLWDPLFSMPGNDRMTEHFARLTAIAIRKDGLLAAAPELISLRSTDLVQRGMWDSWQYVASSVSRQQKGRPTRTSVRNSNSIREYRIMPRHERSGLRLLPSLEVAAAPFATSSRDWRVSEDNGSDQYLPAYGSIRSFDAVAAWLQRDHRGMLLVRGRTESPSPAGAHWKTVLWDGIEYHGFDVVTDGRLHTTVAAAPLTGHVVSMEAMLPDSGALRARLGAMPPAFDSMRISDIILVREDPGPAPTPAQVAAQMLPSWEWRRDAGPMRLYWEYYLPPAVTTVNVRLQVFEQRDGIWSSVASVFGSTAQTRSMSWSDELAEPHASYRGRSVAIDLSSLPEREYRMTLTVAAGDLLPVSVERVFRLR